MAAFASLWGVPFLQHNYQLSSSAAASMILFVWLGIAVASPFLGWWSDRINSRRVPLFLSALVGLISFTLLLWWPPTVPWGIGVLLFLIGMASSGQALSFGVVRDIREHGEIAAAIGFNNMAVVISGAIFQPLIGFLIQWYANPLSHASTTPFVGSDYRFGLTVLIGGYLLACILSLCLIRESLG